MGLLSRFFRNRKVKSTLFARYSEFAPTNYSERLSALKTLHVVRAMHTLLAGAAGRLRWSVKSVAANESELALYSELADAYASILFADYMILGEARFRKGFVRDLSDYDYAVVHPAPPLEAASVLISKLYELERAEYQAFWRQGASVFAVVTNDGSHVALPSQVEAARKQLQDNIRRAGAGGIEILPVDLEFKEIQRGLADYDFPGQKIHLIRELCNLFAVDSSLLNDPENKTYSNKTEAQKALFVNVIIPNAFTFAQAVTRHLAQEGEAIRLEVSYDEVESIAEMRLDAAQAMLALYNAGIVNKDEVRKVLGYE